METKKGALIKRRPFTMKPHQAHKKQLRRINFVFEMGMKPFLKSNIKERHKCKTGMFMGENNFISGRDFLISGQDFLISGCIITVTFGFY